MGMLKEFKQLRLPPLQSRPPAGVAAGPAAYNVCGEFRVTQRRTLSC
jgi:hypothetical protein